jgi:hypothetical protein
MAMDGEPHKPDIERFEFESDEAAIAAAQDRKHNMRVGYRKFEIELEYLAECIACQALILKEVDGRYSGTALVGDCYARFYHKR